MMKMGNVQVSRDFMAGRGNYLHEADGPGFGNHSRFESGFLFHDGPNQMGTDALSVSLADDKWPIGQRVGIGEVFWRRVPVGRSLEGAEADFQNSGKVGFGPIHGRNMGGA